MQIVLPIPLPTWNRVMAMHHWERKKLRDLIHLFVSLSIRYGKDWPTLTEYQGKQCSTESLKADYYKMIRPSSSKASATRKRKAKKK